MTEPTPLKSDGKKEGSHGARITVSESVGESPFSHYTLSTSLLTGGTDSSTLSLSRMRRLQEMDWIAEEEMIRAAAQLESRRLDARNSFAKGVSVLQPKSIVGSVDGSNSADASIDYSHNNRNISLSLDTSFADVRHLAQIRPTREHNSLFDAESIFDHTVGSMSPRSERDALHGNDHRSVLSDSMSVCSDSDYVGSDSDLKFFKLRRKWIPSEPSRIRRDVEDKGASLS